MSRSIQRNHILIMESDFRNFFTPAKNSMYAWIPDNPHLFCLQLCDAAVDNLKSPPDVFVVPVEFRKLSFSQIDYCWGLLM